MWDESTARVFHYAYDRWTQPGWTISMGCLTVWSLGTLEGYLQLPKLRFAARYGTYNILPSLIWGTQPPGNLLATSPTLSKLTYLPPSPKHKLWIKILCSLRGAVAGSVVLSNVIALTSLWQKAQDDYKFNIRNGREPPMIDQPTVIRLAGIQSNTTMLSLQREQRIWPVFETTASMSSITEDARRPVYWKVNDGEYSKTTSWKGMRISKEWLFPTATKKLLYLEADATAGDESSLALFSGSSTGLWPSRYNYSSKLDLDLKEVGQGFRRLRELGDFENVLRVLLVDCSVTLTSGGGHKTSVRERVDSLEIADIVIDARATVLHALLSWLRMQNSKTIILETPSVAWFKSIQAELKKHGYKVIDRGSAPNGRDLPMLVYERSSADTIHTITQYLEQGFVKADRVCALMTGHDELDHVESSSIKYVCSSDIYDRIFRKVKELALHDRPIQEIQALLDSGEIFDDHGDRA